MSWIDSVNKKEAMLGRRHDLHARAGRLARGAPIVTLVISVLTKTAKVWIVLIACGLIFISAGARAQQKQTGENVDVRSGINHGEFDRLLKKYVNEQGLVNYAAWKQSAVD